MINVCPFGCCFFFVFSLGFSSCVLFLGVLCSLPWRYGPASWTCASLTDVLVSGCTFEEFGQYFKRLSKIKSRARIRLDS